MITEKKIKCQNVEINYVDEGNGDVILFIHNGGGFWQIWIKQIEFFSKTHRVIAIDLPGFGKSDESETLYTIDFYFQIIDDFVQKLGIQRLNLVGNCIGASLSIQFKQKYPEKVNKLVLMNICPGERLITSGFMRFLLFKTKSERFHRILKSLLVFVFTKTAVKKRFPAILFGDDQMKNSSVFKLYIKKIKEPKQTRSRINLLFSLDSYTLKRFFIDKQPLGDVNLLWGEKNRVASLKKEGIYHKNFCGVNQFIVLKNRGHLLMYEAPEETNHLITEQLNG